MNVHEMSESDESDESNVTVTKYHDAKTAQSSEDASLSEKEDWVSTSGNKSRNADGNDATSDRCFSQSTSRVNESSALEELHSEIDSPTSEHEDSNHGHLSHGDEQNSERRTSEDKHKGANTSKYNDVINKSLVFLYKQMTEVKLMNESLQAVTIRDGLCADDITEDDEVWILQCPISLDPSALKKKNVIVEGTSDLTIGHKDLKQKYEISSSRDMAKPITCLLPSRESGTLTCKTLQPEGMIIIKETLDVPEFGHFADTSRNVEMPERLKERHPLFGAAFTEELEVRNAILQRVHTKQHSRNRIHKKKRKRTSDSSNEEKTEIHKKKKKKDKGFDVQKGHINELDNSASERVVHKKKKDKSSNFQENNNKMDDYESEIVAHKKKKKDKSPDYQQDNNKMHGYGSEIVAHEKKKKDKSPDFQEDSNKSEIVVHKKKKKEKISDDHKKKKKKHAGEHDHKELKKKKHKRKERKVI